MGRKTRCRFQHIKKGMNEEAYCENLLPKKEIVLTTNASKLAVSVILSQNSYPFMYLSRTLTSTEANYLNKEKRALTIVWSTERVRKFLLG